MLRLLLMITCAIGTQDSKAKSPETKGNATSSDKVEAATPEEAFRTFFVAMTTKDEATLRAVTLPTNEFDWLLKGEGVPAERASEFKAMVAQMPIKTLKAGDEFAIPGRGKQKVSASDVTAERAVLLPEGAPLPTRARKVDGLWKIDATPIIAGRKAADAARRKAEGKGK